MAAARTRERLIREGRKAGACGAWPVRNSRGTGVEGAGRMRALAPGGPGGRRGGMQVGGMGSSAGSEEIGGIDGSRDAGHRGDGLAGARRDRSPGDCRLAYPQFRQVVAGTGGRGLAGRARGSACRGMPGRSGDYGLRDGQGGSRSAIPGRDGFGGGTAGRPGLTQAAPMNEEAEREGAGVSQRAGDAGRVAPCDRRDASAWQAACPGRHSEALAPRARKD